MLLFVCSTEFAKKKCCIWLQSSIQYSPAYHTLVCSDFGLHAFDISMESNDGVKNGTCTIEFPSHRKLERNSEKEYRKNICGANSKTLHKSCFSIDFTAFTSAITAYSTANSVQPCRNKTLWIIHLAVYLIWNSQACYSKTCSTLLRLSSIFGSSAVV